MLAAHRDQENLVHSHQVPVKQQPKTPGARYPKTPLRLGRNDENAPTAFGGKSVIKGATNLGGNDKLMPKGTGARQALVTPSETRMRAPLGNKTTNAKSRTGQGQGIGVKDIEKTQGKQTTVQKPKQRPAELASRPLVFESQQSQAPHQEEPEYAPPRPEALPYESDILPEGGLTFEGLKKANLMRGYYEHFYNPVDENGMTRREKEFNEEMKAVMEKAVGRNERDAEELTWNAADVPEEPVLSQRKKLDKVRVAANTVDKRAKVVHQRQPTTTASRRAASALAFASDAPNMVARAPTSSVPARKPLALLIRGNKPNKSATQAQSSCTGSSAGEAASRTTIGYTKGRSASSVLHHRGESITNRPSRAAKAPSVASNDETSQLTITPARLRQGAFNKESAPEGQSRPQFLSLFDDHDEDDGDLLPINIPYEESDDEDSFDLKLDI